MKKEKEETVYMRLPDTSRYLIAMNGAYSVQTIPFGTNFKPRGYAIFCATNPKKLAISSLAHKLVIKKMYKQKSSAIKAMNKLAEAKSLLKLNLVIF